MDNIQLVELVIKGLILPLAIIALKYLVVFLQAKTKCINDDKYYKLAGDAITTAVQETMQVYVNDLKKSDRWTEETKTIAFEKAREKALLIMSDTVKNALPLIVGDVNAWVNACLEASTLNEKKDAV